MEAVDDVRPLKPVLVPADSRLSSAIYLDYTLLTRLGHTKDLTVISTSASADLQTRPPNIRFAQRSAQAQLVAKIAKYSHDKKIDSLKMEFKMDALPDELLLLILGHLNEAETLLDVVPLVCKRWRRLSRDPAAWASVDVRVASSGGSIGEIDYLDDEEDAHVEDSDGDAAVDDDGSIDGEGGEDGNEVLEDLEDGGDGSEDPDVNALVDRFELERHHQQLAACRILMLAPYLRSVTISWSYSKNRNRPLACSPTAHCVLSALLRSEAAVRRLSLDEDDDFVTMTLDEPESERVDLLVRLLSHFKGSLRYLRLGHLQLLASQRVQDVLSEMKQLRSICLTLHPESNVLNVQVREALLPGLECLQLDLRRDAFHEDAPLPAVLLAGLVRGATGRLRRLDFLEQPGSLNYFIPPNLRVYPSYTTLPPTVTAEMRRCDSLRELTCNLADAAVLAALPQLVSVTLHFDGNVVSRNLGNPDEAAIIAELTATAQALAAAEPVASLRQLRIEMRSSYANFDSFMVPQCIRSAVSGLLGAVALVAAEATSLKLKLPDPAFVEPFLEHMPRLRSAAISFGTGRALALLARLPELEELNLTVPNRLTEQSRKATLDLLSEAAPEHLRLQRLRTLHVRLEISATEPENEPALRAVLEATATAASAATTLHLDSEWLEPDHPAVDIFLQRMPRLRVVELSYCVGRTVALLSQLPELEELGVREWPPFTSTLPSSGAWLADRNDEAFEDETVGDVIRGMERLRSLYVANLLSPGVLAALAELPRLERLTATVLCRRPEDADSCEPAVEDFKARRPDVRSDITVEAHEIAWENVAMRASVVWPTYKVATGPL